MTKPLSVALVGFWHVHAADYAKLVAASELTSLVAVWDDDHERGRAGADEFGLEFVDDLDRLLARDDIDAVIVTTATNQHSDIIARAARAGKHIFSEKLLAPTVAEAESLVGSAARHGVTLVVSLPRLSSGSTIAVKSIIDRGAIGEITYSRIRLAHDGWSQGWLPDRFGDPVQAIGGIFTDLGVHPAYLTQLFLGDPVTIDATYTRVTGRGVEDNAVVTATFPNGAIGVFETSSVSRPGGFTIEVHGTEGSILFGFGAAKLFARGDHFDLEQWAEQTVPPDDPGPFEQWLAHIAAGTRADDNLRAAVELTRIVVAANRSANETKAIAYP